MIIYSVGVRDIDGKYTEFMSSADKDSVYDYAKTIGSVVDDCFDILILEEQYEHISTTPHFYIP